MNDEKWDTQLRKYFLFKQKIDRDVYDELVKFIGNLLKECRKRTIKLMKNKFQKQGRLL